MKPDFPRFKAAAVQASPVVGDAPNWFDLGRTLDKASSLIAEAGRNGARLIVFPECWLPCYPYWSVDFADRRNFDAIWAELLWNSVEVPGPETEALGRAAEKAEAYVVMGINERDKKYPGRMYNTILYLGPRGEIVGAHRKICITIHERLFHTPADGGDNLKAVFPTEIGSIGGSICGEHAQLLQLHAWIMQGIQVHCSLWPGMVGTELWADISTRNLCRVGHLFGVLSAACFSESAMPKGFYRNTLFNAPGSIRGGSGIVGPTGEYIAGPVFDEETIVYGDVDLAQADRTRTAVNLTGIYSRWDLLNVNVQPQGYEPLVTRAAGGRSDQDTALVAKIARLERELAGLRGDRETKDGG